MPCRSIIPKLDELRVIASLQNPDIICIVESWLDSSILDTELIISNYTLTRLDQTRHGGGILVYIKDSLPFSVIVSGPNCLEFICIKVHGCSFSNEFCLGVLYNPPDNVRNVLLSLYTFLQTLSPSLFSNFVLLGDFNVNYLDSSVSYWFLCIK